jgi:cell wall-associated NlpC family hydrolase
MTLREDIVLYARAYIGTPFHHAARMPGVGIDCVGLLVCVARDLLLVPQDFDVPPYQERPDGNTMVEWCDRFMGARVPKSAMQPGDAIVMVADQYPQHLGILGNHVHGGLSIIHASNTARPARVVETRLEFSRFQRFIAAYSFPMVDLWAA